MFLYMFILNYLFELIFFSSSLLISNKDNRLRSKKNFLSINCLFSIYYKIKFCFILPRFLIIANPNKIVGTPIVKTPK